MNNQPVQFCLESLHVRLRRYQGPPVRLLIWCLWNEFVSILAFLVARDSLHWKQFILVPVIKKKCCQPQSLDQERSQDIVKNKNPRFGYSSLNFDLTLIRLFDMNKWSWIQKIKILFYVKFNSEDHPKIFFNMCIATDLSNGMDPERESTYRGLQIPSFCLAESRWMSVNVRWLHISAYGWDWLLSG